ncbi:MAG: SDR family oxidoreductase [Candidatus Omnitrophota bacterium]|nr:SDR family oxidoreductase [Candidatus Omnitrophota bacterium]MBU1928676.1 SDR family oxidoreductase [Candidatus Omnitrophota bacterium]MBU2035759.1 SDR family oxidoreductase [Candidatus Omnitrophota bacterium]MBU2222316.1 SDR family oxidoreductase [Candidatus Omnitrophota bacterium]MBU2258524.1 SDR family oxidoreductase [Candidatus Omnitrophota bacterium]
MPKDLKGKTAIVTGASRGIGKAIAQTVASLGINLAIAARQEGPLKETAEEIRQKYKVRVLAVPCDVTKFEDLESLVNKTKENFGEIDILINNAGVSSQYPFEKQPFEDFERLVHTNYLGYVRLIRLVINDMIKNQSGAIINMVSGSTLCDPLPRNFLVYSSLKVGLRAFSKGLFWELRDHGIKITSILPGVTDTDLTGKLQEITADTSRLMTTEAIENAVKFALTVPANVCPLEIAVINQQTPWTAPVIPFKQAHPGK